MVWNGIENQVAVPTEIALNFPNLVAEVPHAFARTVQGRLPLIRVGWGVQRPMSDESPAPAPAPGAEAKPPPETASSTEQKPPLRDAPVPEAKP